MDSSGTPDQPTWWVACLCAAWCGVCREWQPLFTDQARAHPHMRFAWVDVEDEDDAMGEVDIETFPTLLVAQGRDARFLGPVQPSAVQVGRLLEGLRQDPRNGVTVAPEAGPLLDRLHGAMLLKR